MGALDMTTVEWIDTIVVIVGGAAGIYFGWQQNQIFREQNKIFAAQAGIKMPEPSSRNRLGLYWPAIAALLLSVGVGVVLAKNGTVSIAVPWSLVALLTFGTTLSVMRLKSSLASQQSAIAENAELKRQLSSTARELRLEILSALWGIEGIEVFDVKAELVEKQRGNSLAERVTVGLFRGRDPLIKNPHKVLKVRYTFDGREETIIRREWNWIVLPENRLLEDQLNGLQAALKKAREVTSVSIASQGVLVAGPAAHAEDRARQEAAKQPLGDLLSPLQIEAFTIAKELRDFLAGLQPFPENPEQDPGESNYDYVVRTNASERLQKLFAAEERNRDAGGKNSSTAMRLGSSLKG
jgi:hypothetical protein